MLGGRIAEAQTIYKTSNTSQGQYSSRGTLVLQFYIPVVFQYRKPTMQKLLVLILKQGFVTPLFRVVDFFYSF